MSWSRNAVAAAALVLSLLPAAANGSDVVPTDTPAASVPASTETPTEPTSEPAAPTEPKPEPAASSPEPSAPTAVTAAAEPAQGPRIMVVGDSMSAKGRYSATGGNGTVRAWWSYLGYAAGAVQVNAVSGSGMLSPGWTHVTKPGPELDQSGAACKTSSRFIDRLGAIDLTVDALVVAGGRNDFKRCVNGRVKRATTAQSTAAIKGYLKALRTHIEQSTSLTPDKVYVLNPWGSTFPAQHATIASIMERYTEAYGFTWVMVPGLLKSDTIDGTHPNARGAKKLGTLVRTASDIDGASAKRGVSVKCEGISACGRKGWARSSYRKATDHHYWSQPYGPRNYVAYRLTHHGRVTKRPDATVPSTWKNAAIRAGESVSATPRTGTIAWWPAGVLGDDGHLAYVEQVSSDGTTVWVSEMIGRTYRRTSYSASSYPRAFITFSKAKGTPFGRLTSVTSPKHHRITVSGYASDPDAYTRGVRVRLTVTQGSRSRTFWVSGRTRFGFTKTITGLRTARAVVRAKVYNAPGSKGSSSVKPPGRSVRVR